MDALARPIVAQYALSNGILATSVKDLSDADAKTRSRGGAGPSVAWTIGHLCHCKTQMLGLMGRPEANPFAAKFDKTAATDGADYPTLGELMASFRSLNDKLSSAVGDAAPGQLDGPMPGAGPHDEKKILDTILFFAWHEAYHIGAIGAIRKELGRKSIAELVTGR